METKGKKRMSGISSCLLWPFTAIWRLMTFIFEFVGRFVAITMGLIVMLLGVLISLTGIGAIIGIPLLLFGVVLIIRGFF
jgi:hypothetical protein